METGDIMILTAAIIFLMMYFRWNIIQSSASGEAASSDIRGEMIASLCADFLLWPFSMMFIYIVYPDIIWKPWRESEFFIMTQIGIAIILTILAFRTTSTFSRFSWRWVIWRFGFMTIVLIATAVTGHTLQEIPLLKSLTSFMRTENKDVDRSDFKPKTTSQKTLVKTSTDPPLPRSGTRILQPLTANAGVYTMTNQGGITWLWNQDWTTISFKEVSRTLCWDPEGDVYIQRGYGSNQWREVEFVKKGQKISLGSLHYLRIKPADNKEFNVTFSQAPPGGCF